MLVNKLTNLTVVGINRPERRNF